MELTVAKQVIRMKEDVKTEMQEHALDSEIILPDFCPDIARILKCKGDPKILSKQIGGGQMNIEGTVAVQLLYVDENGEICFYTQNVPFYHEMSVPEEEITATVVAKMDYCNCRAANARKVELHGAVSMRVHLKKIEEVPVVVEAAGAGIELLQAQNEVTTLLSINEKNITITDEIQIASGSVRSILRSSAIVRDGEYKAVTGKAVVKGNLEISALYQNNDGGFEPLRTLLPFTQIMDLEGLDDESDCSLRFEVTSLELRTRTGLDGECKNVMVAAGITVNVEATKTVSLPMVTDAYSTHCGLGIRRYAGNLRKMLPSVHETQLCKKQLELGREITSVVDVWCDVTSDRTVCDGNTIKVSGVLSLSILAMDSDHLPVYLEKAMDYTWEHAMEGSAGELICDPIVAVQSLSYSLTGDSTMDIRAELQIHAQIFETLACNVISDVSADETIQAAVSPAPLVIYYARAGERVFDIARRYNTTSEAIVSANTLTELILSEGKALLIPAVG